MMGQAKVGHTEKQRAEAVWPQREEVCSFSAISVSPSLLTLAVGDFRVSGQTYPARLQPSHLQTGEETLCLALPTGRIK